MSRANIEREGEKRDARSLGRDPAAPIRFVRMLGTARRLAGTESQALKLVNHLPDYGYEVHVVWNDIANPEIPKTLRSEVTWHSLGVARKRDPRILWRAYRLFRRLRPDVFMGSMLQAIYWGRAAAIAAGVPVIISHTESPHPKGKLWMRIFDRLLVGRTDVISALSHGCIAAEKQRIGRPDLPTQLFPNNIDLEEFRQAMNKDSNLRRLVGAEADTVVFIAVGTFRWEKAYDILLKAWARLRPVPEQTHLVIVGAGGLFEETKALAADLGITNTVSFPGWRQDVPALMKDADVFVLSSVSEGGPNVILEAAAASLPIVASEACGGFVREQVVDEVSALVVEPGSVEELAGALAAVLQMSADKRRKMGEVGYNHVAENFSFSSPNNTAAKIDRVCRRILTEKGCLQT